MRIKAIAEDSGNTSLVEDVSDADFTIDSKEKEKKGEKQQRMNLKIL